MMLNRGLSAKPPRYYCIKLIIITLFLYILESPFITELFDTSLYDNIVNPILWTGFAIFIKSLPQVRPKAKLKFYGFVNLWAFNFAVVLIIALVIGGVFDGFGLSPYSHTPKGILINILSVGSMLTACEFLRSYLVNTYAKDENYLVFITVALFITFLNLSLAKIMDLKGYKDTVQFIAERFAPEFCLNLFAIYLAYLGGVVPALLYMGLYRAFYWLSPVLPNLKWITAALIGIMCPIFSLTFLQSIYEKLAKELKRRDRSEDNPISWMATCMLSIAIIWFSVGVFPIYPSVIATGSMEPMIMPGDVILVNKGFDKKSLKTGDVIQFKNESILISHRIIDIIEDENGKGYITKGDNNSTEDTEPVRLGQVKGIIISVIPKIGWPTLLIRSSEDIPLEKVQF